MAAKSSSNGMEPGGVPPHSKLLKALSVMDPGYGYEPASYVV